MRHGRRARDPSQLPRDLEARVGSVRAESSRLDGRFEIAAELRDALDEPGERPVDRAGHVDPRALDVRSGASGTVTDPEVANQLLAEEVDFRLVARRTLRIVETLRLLELLAEV